MNGIEAYAFDLFGTLVDYGSLAAHYPLARPSGGEFVKTWRGKQLTLAMAATLMDRYADFDVLTAAAYAYAAAAHGLDAGAPAQAEAIAAWRALPPHPDVAPALARLRASGIPAAVLSNGSPVTLAAVLRNAQLEDAFDLVLSVDAVRVFKPHRAVYALACERLGLPADRLGFVSSNGWDATGAAEFGLRVVWCNRQGAPRETFGAAPEREIATLAEL